MSDMELFDALAETPLTAHATAKAIVGDHIQMIDEFLVERDKAPLTAAEREILLNLPLKKLREMLKALAWRGEPRSVISPGGIDPSPMFPKRQ
ncbi:hypothetical protein [Rhizobium leguminosarum]|uniref:hypothetical protein n=1 Tax=Rhizobium leguminosarum TaxID=384 RepID=UPI002E0F2533|nr:hypothetical protein U8Q02_38510 [Rhizobium leguminosarum]